jgi:SAM-dependent methyltransferase
MSHKKHIHRHYAHRISPQRENYDVLDWASTASQHARFQVLVDNIDLAGLSILDVGCGLGDLWAFLHATGINTTYTGVDILEEMVEAARLRHAGGHYQQADIFDGDAMAGLRFDVVFCSGAFNLNLGNNLEFLPRAVERMASLARQYVVFNLLHSRAASETQQYFYHDPENVRRMLRPLPCSVKIVDDYLPNDFTVICQIKK